jgi:hypothetical protein
MFTVEEMAMSFIVEDKNPAILFDYSLPLT